MSMVLAVMMGCFLGLSFVEIVSLQWKKLKNAHLIVQQNKEAMPLLPGHVSSLAGPKGNMIVPVMINEAQEQEPPEEDSIAKLLSGGRGEPEWDEYDLHFSSRATAEDYASLRNSKKLVAVFHESGGAVFRLRDAKVALQFKTHAEHMRAMERKKRNG